MPVLTECAAALLSFRYASIYIYIYINDLCNITHYASPTATTRMYADDTNLTYSVCSISELQKSM